MAKPSSGPRLVFNDRDVWEINWTDAGRSKRLSTKTSDEREARAFFSAWLVAPKTKAVEAETIRGLLDRYLTEHVEHECLAADRQGFAAAALTADLGDLTPAELTAARLLLYRQRRKAGTVNGRAAGDSTIRRELVVLKAALRYAVAQKRLSADSLPVIAMPPSAPPKDLWLTEEEVKVLRAAVHTADGPASRLERFVGIALDTAARKSSILELRWEQVDLAAGVIHFQSDGERQKGKRRVAVPMSAELLAAMQRWRAERTQDEWVLDTPFSIQRHWETAMDTLAESTGNDRFAAATPHTLRHTWATQAARAGVDLWQIAGVLGDTPATVQRNYMHHAPEHLRSAVNFRRLAAA